MNKYKKIISIVSLCLCIMTMVFCRNTMSPTESVEMNMNELRQGKGNEFLAKAINDRIEKAYDFVMYDNTREAVYNLYKDIEYTIIKEEIIEESKSVVLVEASMPNITKNISKSLLECISNLEYISTDISFSDEEVMDMMNEYVLKGLNNITYETEISINLSKKDEAWTLDEDKESLLSFIGKLDPLSMEEEN